MSMPVGSLDFMWGRSSQNTFSMEVYSVSPLQPHLAPVYFRVLLYINSPLDSQEVLLGRSWKTLRWWKASSPTSPISLSSDPRERVMHEHPFCLILFGREGQSQCSCSSSSPFQQGCLPAQISCILDLSGESQASFLCAPQFQETQSTAYAKGKISPDIPHSI